MLLQAHGDRKYQSSALLGGAAEWGGLRVEHRQIGPGVQNCVRPECTELVYILSGQAIVRRTGDGQKQEGIARPGSSWRVPVGTHETLLELDGSTECLLIFLPGKLLEDSALAKRTQLYAGGFADPTIAQIGTALRDLLGCETLPIDRIFADGLRTALAAHLIGSYAVHRLRPPARAPSLDPKRLKRVLDFIEARLTDNISLDDLAREACLSPYHFSRVFRQATGLPPHQYLTERRIRAAQKMLSSSHASMAEIALDAGFGSQSSFARAFRKIAGVSPRRYRELYRRWSCSRHGSTDTISAG